MNARDLLTELKRCGWEFYREAKGSHELYRHPKTGAILTVAGASFRKDFTRHTVRKLRSQIRNPERVLGRYSAS